MTTNPELSAALAVVPEIARTEALLEDAKKRLREHPSGVVPDVARNEVIDAAVRAFQADGSWPRDVGKRAAKAHVEASEWHAERIARDQAKKSTELLAYDTRVLYSADALEHLGTRLDDVLSDAREAAEVLAGVRSADAAIKAGGAVVEAWGRLQGLLVDLTNIRAAQWELILPRLRPGDAVGGFDEERRKVRAWRSDGHGEIRSRLDDVPGFALEAMRSQRYTEVYLLFLADVGTTYVPTSATDLEAHVVAATDPISYTDDQTSRYRPTVTPIPTPPAPALTGAERTPALSY
ncbi:hypothetical protein ACFWP5_02895 [Streptomyces sp. NPDC058469]|uniref:hypothetical protein n=1 Tax=Streptomyces sp. NPDC058469 TaxID=3346514 RepID=UPI00365818D1